MSRNVISVGFKDFERTVNRFERHVIREIKRIVAETAEMAVSQMKALAPVGDGNLKRSIDVTYAQGGLTAIIRVGASYAIYIEYGTGIYSTEGTGRQDPWVYFKNGRYYFTRGIRPQPFWNPSVESAMRHFRDEMNRL
jgi:HK97 gp10 family phage protein